MSITNEVKTNKQSMSVTTCERSELTNKRSMSQTNKRITYDKTYNDLPINTNVDKQLRCNTVILNRLCSQSEYMSNNHSKVLQVRLDLHYPQNIQIEPKQSDFSKFNKNFKRNLERNYKLPKEGKLRSEKTSPNEVGRSSGGHKVDPHITLVIENHANDQRHMNSSKCKYNEQINNSNMNGVNKCNMNEVNQHPHAHVLVHVNGNAKRSAYDIQQRAVREWDTIIKTKVKQSEQNITNERSLSQTNNGLVDFCNKNGPSAYLIDRNDPNYEDIKKQAFYQASYLAKTRGKEDKAKGSWTMLGTRLPKNNN
jgi:hypothetical protein